MTDIKLLPEDGGDAIEVPAAPTVIGRGAFLKVTDKRVSRSHALLEVTDGKLYLTPTHTNPCFYRRGGKGTQQVLKKDVPQTLEEGDMFGLLPDQLFYTISYGSASLNGVETNGASKKPGKKRSPVKKNEKITKPVKKEDSEEEDTNFEAKEKVTLRDVMYADGKNMALPLTKKRKLPAWMIHLSSTKAPAGKQKAGPAKMSPAKRAAPSRPGPKKTNADADFLDDNEEDESLPKKNRKEESKQPYKRGKVKRDLQQSDEFDSEEEQPKKTKAAKRPKRKESDEDNDLEVTAKRGRGRNSIRKHQSHSDESSSRRPKRAATKIVGSYEEDFLVGDEFDASDEIRAKRDSDSDFRVDGNDGDSGSDWEKRRGSPKKQAKKAAGRTPTKGRGKRKARRGSDFYEDDFEESEDEYIPRPSKRRGGSVQRRRKATDSEEDEGDEEVKAPKKMKKSPSKKANKGKKPCYYGSKCYRRNPDHFKQFSHPGDSDEEDREEDSDQEKEGKGRKRGNNKISKPETSKAPVKKKVKDEEEEDDDGLPNTYDYNDSFIDDGGSQSLSQTQRTEGDSEDEDVNELRGEAKAFIRNKKMMKPVADYV